MVRDHGHQRQYSCEICGIQFIRQNYYRKHMNRHEKNPDKKIRNRSKFFRWRHHDVILPLSIILTLNSPKTKHRQLGPTNYAFQQTPLSDFSLDLDSTQGHSSSKNEPIDETRIQEITDGEKPRDDVEVKTEMTESTNQIGEHSGSNQNEASSHISGNQVQSWRILCKWLYINSLFPILRNNF